MGVLDRSKTESKEVFAINMASNSSLDVQRTDIESQSDKDVKKSKCRNVWWKIAFDVPLVVIVFTLIGLYELCVIPSHKGGFFCNDPGLSHIFNGDTVSSTVLVTTVLGFPLFIVLFTEFLLHTKDYSIKQNLKYSTLRTLLVYRGYICGLLCNFIVVEAMKGITGSPRPVFFDVCEPDTGKTCNGSEYVSSFTCTSTRYSAWAQYDSYHSFPSGHTSTSVHCGFFIAWYLQRRAFGWSSKTALLVPILQLLSIVYAAVCSLTRITDHRHHWWDVVVGTAIGLGTCYYAINVLLRNFKSATADSSSNVSTKRLFNNGRVVTA